MTQLNHVTKNNTVVFNDGQHTIVKYHQTNVVKFNHNEIILNSNGWHTYTTKVRMNQTSNQYNLGYQVFQKDYEWFVKYHGYTLEFDDGLYMTREISYRLKGSISHGTLILDDIVDAIEQFTKDNDILDWILDQLFNEYFSANEGDKIYIYEEIFDRMNDIAPNGLYFGSHIGDGSDIGYWPSEWLE